MLTNDNPTEDQRHGHLSTPYQPSAGCSWQSRSSAIWIALAFWPARVARRKGHSFIGDFIFSLIFFPVALVTAYLVHDRHQPTH
jgi:hypothetical protein